jgi:hypothetical protein
MIARNNVKVGPFVFIHFDGGQEAVEDTVFGTTLKLLASLYCVTVEKGTVIHVG